MDGDPLSPDRFDRSRMDPFRPEDKTVLTESGESLSFDPKLSAELVTEGPKLQFSSHLFGQPFIQGQMRPRHSQDGFVAKGGRALLKGLRFLLETFISSPFAGAFVMMATPFDWEDGSDLDISDLDIFLQKGSDSETKIKWEKPGEGLEILYYANIRGKSLPEDAGREEKEINRRFFMSRHSSGAFYVNFDDIKSVMKHLANIDRILGFEIIGCQRGKKITGNAQNLFDFRVAVTLRLLALWARKGRVGDVAAEIVKVYKFAEQLKRLQADDSVTVDGQHRYYNFRTQILLSFVKEIAFLELQQEKTKKEFKILFSDLMRLVKVLSSQTPLDDGLIRAALAHLTIWITLIARSKKGKELAIRFLRRKDDYAVSSNLKEKLACWLSKGNRRVPYFIVEQFFGTVTMSLPPQLLKEYLDENTWNKLVQKKGPKPHESTEMEKKQLLADVTAAAERYTRVLLNSMILKCLTQ